MTVTYIAGAELGDLEVTWQDSDGAVIDFSTGYTFQVKVGRRGSASFTKTTGITGAATAPNVVIAWSTSGELNNLPANDYTVQIVATRDSDSKQRIMHTELSVASALI